MKLGRLNYRVDRDGGATWATRGLTLLLETDLLVRTVEALHDGATMQSLLEPDELPLGTLQQEVIPRLLARLPQ